MTPLKSACSPCETKNRKPIMLTPQGAVLSGEEKELYSTHRPYGFILFGKHCETPAQVQKLCADLRDCVGDDVVIAIDQEGGRVARMREPEWPNFPAASDMTHVYQTYFDLGTVLKNNGLTMNFAPCLDVVPEGGKCDAIGNRCFSSNPKIAGEKGAECIRGLLDSGIAPVIKHMPGHGRAEEDSHFFLPVVKASAEELKQDLIPFQSVCRHPELVSGSMSNQILKQVQDDNFSFAGMTCHVIYEAWDADHPATLSKTVIQNIIRDEIGFKGLLFSDDLAMKALDRYGDIVTRVKLCLDAGCDIALPCHTSLDESKAILESL